MTDLPIACSLDPATLKTRRSGLLAELVRAATLREPLDDGYRFRFAAASETLALIVRVIDGERLCCRFLRFTLVVDPAEGPFELTLTGPPGSRDFLAALIDG